MISDILSRANWRTSSKTQANGSCVELATDGQEWVAVRDSKKPDAGVLVVEARTFHFFLRSVKDSGVQA
ncbi:DUF397 domain-containing protein [Actinophytocola sp.]|uniref:DUF397 domain-containing protein n=1 Tax=Actinophytocola sp. TaxID=1872138 RepID=UPI002EDB7EDD